MDLGKHETPEHGTNPTAPKPNLDRFCSGQRPEIECSAGNQLLKLKLHGCFRSKPLGPKTSGDLSAGPAVWVTELIKVPAALWMRIKEAAAAEVLDQAWQPRLNHQELDRRFWSMFPFTRIPFCGYHILEHNSHFFSPILHIGGEVHLEPRLGSTASSGDALYT